MQILAEEAPLSEIYSIYEAFLEPDIKSFASHLNQRVWLEQRIPMMNGILKYRAAKVIPRLNGVCVLDTPEKWEWFGSPCFASKGKWWTVVSVQW